MVVSAGAWGIPDGGPTHSLFVEGSPSYGKARTVGVPKLTGCTLPGSQVPEWPGREERMAYAILSFARRDAP